MVHLSYSDNLSTETVTLRRITSSSALNVHTGWVFTLHLFITAPVVKVTSKKCSEILSLLVQLANSYSAYFSFLLCGKKPRNVSPFFPKVLCTTCNLNSYHLLTLLLRQYLFHMLRYVEKGCTLLPFLFISMTVTNRRSTTSKCRPALTVRQGGGLALFVLITRTVAIWRSYVLTVVHSLIICGMNVEYMNSPYLINTDARMHRWHCMHITISLISLSGMTSTIPPPPSPPSRPPSRPPTRTTSTKSLEQQLSDAAIYLPPTPQDSSVLLVALTARQEESTCQKGPQ